ncbi:MAG: glycoside hydrolase family 95 protein [Bacteroidota bacterium]
MAGELNGNKLWYNKAANESAMRLNPDSAAVNKKFSHEALPLGNGRLGCMAYGGVEREFIEFNEESLWIGDEDNTGAYQAFGEFHVNFKMPNQEVQNYYRELDIDKSLHTISYRINGINYKREYFASNPAGIIIFRFTADQKAAYSVKIRLKDAHKAKISAQKNRITSKGSLEGYVYNTDRNKFGITDYEIALDYEAVLQVKHEGGTLRTEDNTIVLDKADSFIIYLAAGTDYAMDRSKGWKGEHPHKRLITLLNRASNRNYKDLLQEHIADYQNLSSRFDLNLGTSSAELLELPVNERLNKYKEEGHQPDPDLEELLVQYARYLMISSSRPGCLPANLQGIWNNVNNPIWRCDYHSDVNLQMNYWFVDKTNLSECYDPFSDWMEAIRPIRREQTKRDMENVRGWQTHSENGAFGGVSFKIVPGDAAWLAQNSWDHYAFTQDKNYLRERAYPIIKELCEYWQDRLIELPDGTLIAPESKSPEHGPVARGNSYEQQLIWNLFSNYIEGSEALGIDEDFRKQVIQMKSKLFGPQIGKWGQLQEWKEDRDDPKDTHRHVSHMIAVYPSMQIAPRTTPEFADAAKVSLIARRNIEKTTAWGMAWKASLWSRLDEPQRAYEYIGSLIASRLFPNLLSHISGYTFQIDANFGYAEAVCEMLLQSHLGEINLIPGLPKNWSSGSVKGVVTRGNFTIDMEWEQSKLTRAVIRSGKGTRCKLRTVTPVSVSHNGKVIEPIKEKDGSLSFPTKAGESYIVKSL